MENQLINYEISILNPQTHTVNVTLKFDISNLDIIQLQMPVWTPGSYKVRDFSRHVSKEKASIKVVLFPIN